MGTGGYVLGISLCGECICDYVCLKCPPCGDSSCHRAVYCSDYSSFSEQDPTLEPKGSKDQFTDYKCIQRGDYRSEDL